jgi:hypothetical protein
MHDGIEQNKSHNFFAKNKTSNNAIMKKLIMTLKWKENFDFLVNFMVANAIVILEKCSKSRNVYKLQHIQ